MPEKYTKVYFDPDVLDWLDVKGAESATTNREHGKRAVNRSHLVNALLRKLMTQEGGQNGTGQVGRKLSRPEEAAIGALVDAARNLTKLVRV